MHKGIRGAFHTWMAVHMRIKMDEVIMRRIINLIKGNMYCFVFDAWHESSTYNGRMERIGGAIARRWTNLGLTHCLMGWIENVIRRRKERKSLHIMSRIYKRLAWKSIRHWEELYLDERHHRNMLKKVVGNFRHKFMCMAWHAWLAQHNEEKRHRNVAIKIMSRWVFKCMWNCLRVWEKVEFLKSKLSAKLAM